MKKTVLLTAWARAERDKRRRLERRLLQAALRTKTGRSPRVRAAAWTTMERCIDALVKLG